MRERLLLVICLTLAPGCQEEQGRFSKGVHPKDSWFSSEKTASACALFACSY